MKRSFRISILAGWGICLLVALCVGSGTATAQSNRYPVSRYSQYPDEPAERYTRRARPVMYQEPVEAQPQPTREMGAARPVSETRAPVESRPTSSGRPSNNVQMGYRSTAPRMAQAPAWQRRPDTQMAGRVQPRTISTDGNIFPFEEDMSEQVQPGRPMPAPQGPGPQDYGPMDDGMMYEEPMYEGEYMDGDWGEEGFVYGGGWNAPNCCGPDPMACERYPACSIWSFLNELSVSAGVQAFKGPVDFGRVGNFGFNQSVNVSDSIWHSMGIGYQLGVRFVESNFSGDQAIGLPRQSTRYQTFTTAGLFHRAFYGCGWQYGAVVDYMSDRYYYDNNVIAGLVQVRTELSYLWSNGHEIGFTGMVGTQDQDVDVFGVGRTIVVNDQYRGFYRVNFCDGAFGRVWVGGLGGAGAANAVLGADFRVPIHNRFDITGNFNYLIPTTDQQNVNRLGGGADEAWNLGMSLVFYPGRCAQGTHNGPYRQLFNVADNGDFATRLQLRP